jgi:hypothetical protein
VDENDGNDAGEINMMEATMSFVAGFILGVTVAVVGGIKIGESSLYRQYSCTESAIVNGVTECIEYRRKER